MASGPCPFTDPRLLGRPVKPPPRPAKVFRAGRGEEPPRAAKRTETLGWRIGYDAGVPGAGGLAPETACAAAFFSTMRTAMIEPS